MTVALAEAAVSATPHFTGYATKADIKCSDGRTIAPEAFAHQNGTKVPLVWSHDHDNPENTLGHAILENVGDGMRVKAYFNDSPRAQAAKYAVEHEDITSLSIWANKLKESAKRVAHGMIREVSLVFAGANPGALIDNRTIRHAGGDLNDPIDEDDDVIIYTGLPLVHGEETSTEVVDAETVEEDATLEHVSKQEVYDTLNEDQRALVHDMLLTAIETAGTDGATGDPSGDAAAHSDTTTDDEDNSLAHQEGTTTVTNVFEKGKGPKIVHSALSADATTDGSVLSHDDLKAFAQKVFDDFNGKTTFKDAFLAHAGDYGIDNMDLLFPNAQAIDSKPEWITRRMEWVETVLNGTRKLPFSKIKSLSADLTHDEARAKGYIKGDVKKEQFFGIAKRETGPKTIYKKQKLDKDDITDITDFDVVAWLWVEMRFMLREEIARAILIGDGREIDDADKIDEDKIRPIAFDDPFYTDVIVVDTNIDPASLVEAVIRGRESYLGAGLPTAFMTRSVMNDMLLQRDRQGRRLYRNRVELADELEVSEIVNVPVMEGLQRDEGEVLMILVNLADYAVGSTAGGEISTFNMFDIDKNQEKYLIEGRMSGALYSHKRAQVVVRTNGTEVTPGVPTFVSGTGVVTIPATSHVVYKNAETDATLTAGAQTALASGDTLYVEAVPATGYYFPHNFDADWSYTRP